MALPSQRGVRESPETTPSRTIPSSKGRSLFVPHHSHGEVQSLFCMWPNISALSCSIWATASWPRALLRPVCPCLSVMTGTVKLTPLEELRLVFQGITTGPGEHGGVRARPGVGGEPDEVSSLSHQGSGTGQGTCPEPESAGNPVGEAKATGQSVGLGQRIRARNIMEWLGLGRQRNPSASPTWRKRCG